MNAEDFGIIEHALTHDETVPEETAAAVREALLALLRRDWAVRVLDAWAELDEEHVYHVGPTYALTSWYCSCRRAGQIYAIESHHEKTPDAARHAAAEAVFPTLSDAVRAELGECP